MLELFTDRARQVVVQASDAARALGHEFVGAEHLLLGLIAERSTAEGKSVLELSLAESKRLGDSRIETQHMLLALMKTEQQSGVELLEAIGLDAERVRLEIFRVLTARQSLLAEDMVFAIAEDRQLIGLLAQLGVQVERVAELLERHRSRPAPPDIPGLS